MPHPVVVHCQADLQSVHGFRCYDNMHVRKLTACLQMRIAPNAKCQLVLVLALNSQYSHCHPI